MLIDDEKLRRDLIDYYGSAAFSGMPAAMIDVFDIERASIEELVRLARQAGFNLRNYEDDLER